MTKIKILKDTPFDRAGASLSISEFRLKYNYICSRDVTDEELIAYLQEAHTPGSPQGKMAEFFTLDGIMLTPLELIYNGLLYVKQIDGLYHTFTPGAVITPDCQIGVVPIRAVEDIFFRESKHRKLIWYCTDNAKRKL